MKYCEMTEEQLKKFYGMNTDELGLSVRAYSFLMRNGCFTVAEVAFLTGDELMKLKRAYKKALPEITEKLGKVGITLMSTEEKQTFLECKDDVKVLKTRIFDLEIKEKRYRERVRVYEEREKEEHRILAREKKKNLLRAQELVEMSPSPLSKLMGEMYFGKNAVEGCGFCDIFELWRQECLLEDALAKQEEKRTVCEECIERYMTQYYWNERMEAVIAAENGEAEKVKRQKKDFWGKWRGFCPVCKRQVYRSEQEYFCSKCGYLLCWNENVDEDEIDGADE